MVYITCFILKDKNIHAVFLLYLLVGICLLQCSFSFLADLLTVFSVGKTLAIGTKCCNLDVAVVLNPVQYVSP